MRIILLLFSLMLISTSVTLAVFVDAKAGNVAGGGWTVPFWPFVIAIGFFVNPYLHDMIRFYLKTKVDIARAENRVPDDAPDVKVREAKKPEIKA